MLLADIFLQVVMECKHLVHYLECKSAYITAAYMVTL